MSECRNSFAELRFQSRCIETARNTHLSVAIVLPNCDSSPDGSKGVECVNDAPYSMIVVLLNMIFKDIHDLFIPVFLEEMMTGIVNGNQVTEPVLLIGSIFQFLWFSSLES